MQNEKRERPEKPEVSGLDPVAELFIWIVVLASAPWILFVVRNFGRDGWGFDQWDKWRLHSIPLTYVVYFSLTAVMLPSVDLVLGICFPLVLLGCCLGLGVVVFNAWVIGLIVVLAATVIIVHKCVTSYQQQYRVKQAAMRVTASTNGERSKLLLPERDGGSNEE